MTSAEAEHTDVETLLSELGVHGDQRIPARKRLAALLEAHTAHLTAVEAQCAALQLENEELREQRITANCLRQEAEVTLMACEATSQKRLDDLHAEREARQALQTAIRRIMAEMRSERPRYASHPLGFVDSVSSNRVDEWADELDAALHASEGAK